MTETKHTPEPWKIANGTKSDLYMGWNTVIGKLDDGEKFVLTQTNHHYDVSKANARRIVACVNSCAGITTKFLESFSVLHEINESKNRREHAETDALNASVQRDIALQELREIREAIKADENESTADEVCSLVHQRDRLVLALEEMVKGGDNVCGYENPCSCRFCRSRALIENIRGKS